MIKLAIDAGHGLGNVRPGKVDPGASANGHTENTIALSYAKTLKFYAELEGIGVFMVNTGQDENPVGGRDEQAERAGCTHLLSIHLNAANSKAAKGTMTLYRDSTDMLFAAKAQRATVQSLKLKDLGVKPESISPHGTLAVFGFDGPACLIELGFITNSADLAAILKDENRKLWAQAVIEAISK